MKTAVALFLAAALQPVSSADDTYLCQLDAGVVTVNLDGEWRILPVTGARHDIQFEQVTVTFAEGNFVNMDYAYEAFGLPEFMSYVTIDGGIAVWSAPAPAYCGVVDAICQLSGAFKQQPEGLGQLVLTTPSGAASGSETSVGSLQLLYTCENAA